MPDINTQLRDIAIAHQHMVEQFKTTEVRKVIRLLNQMEADLKDLLSKKSGITNWTRNRQKVLLAQVKELQKVYHGKINATVNGSLKDFGGIEAATYLAEIATVVAPYTINISLNAITPEKVWATAKRNKMMFPDGTTFTLSQMLKTFEVNDITRTKQAIEQGFILGETTPEIQRKIFSTGGKFNITKNNAKTIVRTGLNHLGNTARDLTYSNNTDIVKGYQWVSTLDERTTDICVSRDGLVYYYDASEASTLDGHVLPPAHYACRSVTVPITRSWQELGINLAEAPLGTRASMTGQVPANQTYKQWLATAPASIQRNVLGRTRYDMWKKGEIDIDSFWTKDGRRITLSQLKRNGYEIPNIYVK